MRERNVFVVYMIFLSERLIKRLLFINRLMDDLFLVY